MINDTENLSFSEIRAALINIAAIQAKSTIALKVSQDTEGWTEHQKITIAIYFDALSTIALAQSEGEQYIGEVVSDLMQLFPEVAPYHINAGRHLVQNLGDEKAVRVAREAAKTLENLGSENDETNSALAGLLSDKELEWSLEELEDFFGQDERSFVQPKYEKPAIIWAVILFIAAGVLYYYGYRNGAAIACAPAVGAYIYWLYARKKRLEFEK